MELEQAMKIAEEWESERVCSTAALVARALYRHITKPPATPAPIVKPPKQEE
jgi:hypothetical protein